MNPEHDGPLRHVVQATHYSILGFRAAWKCEMAFRIEAAVIGLMAPVGVWLGRGAVHYALMFGSCALVLIVELLNSSLEAVVDRIGTEPHPLSKRAKDLGSAAAALSQLTAAVIWALIAQERFFG